MITPPLVRILSLFAPQIKRKSFGVSVGITGAFFLAFIAILPNMVAGATNIEGVYFGGTALLIVVGVALDTMKQIEAMVVMRHYQGFMK